MKTPILAILLGISLVSTGLAAPTTAPGGVGNAGGTFATYFTNLATTSCTGDEILLGFKSTPDSDYLRGNCMSIGDTLASFLGGSAPAGQAVTGFDATTGAPIYGSVGSAGWGLSGNTGTNAGTNFIGTIDNVGLNIRTNNTNQITIATGGNVGIGRSNPLVKLDVNGRMQSSGSLTSLSSGPALYLQDTDNSGAILYTNLDRFYIATTAVNARVPITRPFTINLANGNVGIGTLSPGANLDVVGEVRTSDQFISTLATGTSPLAVSSTTVNTNLNADYLDGQSVAYFAPIASPVFTGTPTAPTTTLSDSGTRIATTGYIKSQGYLVAGNESDPEVGANTTNYVSKWNGSALVTSQIFDNGTNVGIGTSGPGYKLEVSGGVGATGFFYTSDRRLKDNITPLQGSLDKVLALSGYSFTWKKDGTPDIGVIAQEVEVVFPDLVKTNSVTGLKSVEYGNLVAPLIEAIKEQDKQIQELRAEIDGLKKSIK